MGLFNHQPSSLEERYLVVHPGGGSKVTRQTLVGIGGLTVPTWGTGLIVSSTDTLPH